MSLLMLKTKDLTHQDHILNFELMLNPTRSGLLLNKHRSLESKRDKEKEICEVERQFAINHFHVEKRMIERRRKILLENAAKRTYYRDSPVSSRARLQEPLEIELSEEDSDSDDWDSFPRSRTRPTRQGIVKGKSTGHAHNRVGMSKSNKNARPTTSSSHIRRPFASVVSEQRPRTTAGGRQGQPTPSSSSNQRMRGKGAEETPFEKEYVPFARRSNAFVSQYTSSVVSGRKEMNAWQSPSKAESSSKGPVTFMTQTDAQQQEIGESQRTEKTEDISKNSPFITALNTEKQNTAEIKSRVGQFLTKVEDFKSRPQSRGSENRAESPWMVRPGKKATSATVAKRYNKLSLDIQKLHSAFDKLCVERNPDELQKIVKLASKLKANVKYARNVSFVPIMGSLKGGKRFKENALSHH